VRSRGTSKLVARTAVQGRNQAQRPPYNYLYIFAGTPVHGLSLNAEKCSAAAHMLSKYCNGYACSVGVVSRRVGMCRRRNRALLRVA
jgi:hypothetical protein